MATSSSSISKSSTTLLSVTSLGGSITFAWKNRHLFTSQQIATYADFKWVFIHFNLWKWIKQIKESKERKRICEKKQTTIFTSVSSCVPIIIIFTPGLMESADNFTSSLGGFPEREEKNNLFKTAIYGM